MPDFGIFRGFNDKLFGNKLYAGQLPTQLGTIGSIELYDIDALAFFDRVTAAGGTLSATEKTAVNQLVLDMKSYAIWSKMKAIYPMVGASAAACAQNLKSSSFTGTFTSGWTFASIGATPNGTSAYFDTTLIPSNEFITPDASFGVYSRTSGSLPADFGRYTSNTQAIISYLSINIGGLKTFSWNGGNNYVNNTNLQNGIGFYNFQRVNSSSLNVFENSTKIINQNQSFTGFPTLSLPFGAYLFNNNFSESAGRQYAFFHIGNALTDTEASNFYTAVQAFQTTLSRQV